jgi:D-glycero-D-manno-heptose 1,7-bisphosphate phosphatase
MYTQADFEALTDSMREYLQSQDVPLAGVYHCPHLPGATVAEFARECDCRKPAPGMLLQAARELDLSLPDSVMYGDKPSDVEAAHRAGVGRAWRLARDGKAEVKPGAPSEPAPDFLDLAAAVDDLLGERR